MQGGVKKPKNIVKSLTKEAKQIVNDPHLVMTSSRDRQIAYPLFLFV